MTFNLLADSVASQPAHFEKASDQAGEAQARNSEESFWLTAR